VPITELIEAFRRSCNAVVFITGEYRTSKLCHNCGFETKKAPLGDRWTRCLNPTCHVGDTNRDITGAEGMLTRGYFVHLDPNERIDEKPNLPPSLQYKSELPSLRSTLPTLDKFTVRQWPLNNIEYDIPVFNDDETIIISDDEENTVGDVEEKQQQQQQIIFDDEDEASFSDDYDDYF
jgi:Putative transposase DNA-binding domain